MSAPAVAKGVLTGIRTPRPRPRIDRGGLAVEIWLRLQALAVYGFPYLPIVVVVIFSFNANRLATIWTQPALVSRGAVELGRPERAG